MSFLMFLVVLSLCLCLPALLILSASAKLEAARVTRPSSDHAAGISRMDAGEGTGAPASGQDSGKRNGSEASSSKEDGNSPSAPLAKPDHPEYSQ